MAYSNFLKKACSLVVQKGGAVMWRALYARRFADAPRGAGRVSTQISRGFGDGGLGGEAVIGGIGSTVAAAMILLV